MQATRPPSKKLIEVLSSSRPDVGFPPEAVLATWTTADLLAYYAFAGEFDMLEDTSLWEPLNAGTAQPCLHLHVACCSVLACMQPLLPVTQARFLQTGDSRGAQLHRLWSHLRTCACHQM